MRIVNSLFIEMNRPRQSWMIAGALLCSENVPRTRRERASAYVAVHPEIGSVFCAALDVGFNSFDMQLDNCILSFVAQKEIQ